MKRRRITPLERDQVIMSCLALRLPLTMTEQRRLAEAPALGEVAAKLRKRMVDGAMVVDGGIIYGSVD